MAGVWAAHALAAGGSRVLLLERAGAIAQGASGNPAGAFHPHVSIDDNPLSRLSRLGCAATLNSLRRLSDQGLLRQGVDWDRPGHLQLARNDVEALKFEEQAQKCGLGADVVMYVDAGRAENLSGLPCRHGGLWFAGGGWLRPASWLAAAQAEAGSDIELHCGVEIETIRRQTGGWCLMGPQGDWSAAVVVIAAAERSLGLCPWRFTQDGVVKGQVSLASAALTNKPRCVVSGSCYAIPLPAGELLMGSTYERPARDTAVTEAGHALNLARWRDTFPDAALPDIKSGRSAWRSVLPGRLPAIGCAVDASGTPLNGLYVSSGLASRGMTWAVLAGQIIAADIGKSNHANEADTPWPMNLLQAIAPSRFVKTGLNGVENKDAV